MESLIFALFPIKAHKISALWWTVPCNAICCGFTIGVVVYAVRYALHMAALP